MMTIQKQPTLLSRALRFLHRAVFLSMLVILLSGCRNDTSGPERGITDAMKIIPTDCVMFAVVKNPSSLAQQIDKSAFLKNLGDTPTGKDFSDLYHLTRKIVPGSLEEAQMIAVCSEKGVSGLSWMILTALPKVDFEFPEPSGTDTLAEKKDYDGCPIHLYRTGDRQYAMFSAGGFLVSTSDPLSAEKVILQIRSQNSLMDDRSFAEGYRAGLSRRNVNVFIRTEKAARFLQEETGHFSQVKRFGEWMIGDFASGEDQAGFNFLVTRGDSSTMTTRILLSQPAGTFTLDRYFPGNTLSYTYYNLSDYKRFFEDFSRFLKATDSYNYYSKWLAPYQELSPGGFPDYFDKWCGRGIASVVSGHPSLPQDSLRSIIVGIKDKETAERELLSISRKEKPIVESYRDISVMAVGKKKIFSHLLDRGFPSAEVSYYAVTDKAAVFSQSLAVLKEILDDISDGRTLWSDPDYRHLRQESDPSPALLFMVRPEAYLQRKKAETSFKKESPASLSPLDKYLVDHPQAAQQAGFLFFQLCGVNDLPFANLTIRRPRVPAETARRIWSFQAEKPILRAASFPNHVNKGWDIVLSDEGNTLYLLSSQGELLWKRKLDSAPRGQIGWVDLFKNNRLQIALATGEKLYVIDRTGKDVSPFPIRLKEKADGGLGIFDYDNNRNYRLAVASTQRIRLYDTQGKTVPGFDFSLRQDKIAQAPSHIRIEGKDIICVQTDKGKLILLNRQGGRLVKTDLENDGTQAVRIDREGRQRLLSADKKGNLYFVGADMKIQKSAEGISSAKGLTGGADHTSAFLYSDKQLARISGGKTTSIPTQASPIEKVCTADSLILYTAGSKTYAVTPDGKPLDGFPLEGAGEIIGKDLNRDGKTEIVTIHKDGRVSGFQISGK